MATYVSGHTANDEENVIVETQILLCTITKKICYLVATVKL